MRRFFEEHRLDNYSLSEGRINSIKRSVLSRIEEDKPMKKRFKFKPLIIAAVIVGTMAVSAVTVNAATNGALLNLIFKTHNTNAFSTKYGEIYIDLEAEQRADSGFSRCISFEYSDDFTSFPVKTYKYNPEDIFDDAAMGEIEIWIMEDGGALGLKYVYATGEISLLNDEEIQNLLDNYEPKYESIMSNEDIQFVLKSREELGIPTI